MEQLLILRRYYLPTEDDSSENLARAAWLDNHLSEVTAAAVANGIGRAFKGVK
ncbi:DUF6890 family protein [Gilliamella sp. wkB308]|uniref:DUF6890 family protein n=1 Tax=Gilliamella sp. wkB308 TaxID=3120263 RepID=UPI0015CF5DB2|nr:hypothetical protein [Gilliamella apicola]